MGKKAKLKMIKKLANSMPAINESLHETHIYTGAEILEWNTIAEIDGEPIDPEKKYTFNYPVLMIQNNQRRMKRAYLKHGVKGIEGMFNRVINIMEQNKLANSK